MTCRRAVQRAALGIGQPDEEQAVGKIVNEVDKDSIV